jgi:hypothetical protein
MHNLCTELTPPENTIELLGLNLKFCIEKSTPPDQTEKAIKELTKSCRTHWLFTEEEDENDYNPKIYLKSKTFDPDPAHEYIEKRIDDLYTEIKTLIKNKKQNPSTNLTAEEHNKLKELREDLRFIIFMTDKNLGPCIMERINYIKKALSEHLENKNSYERLTTQQAWTIRNKAENEITKWYEKHKKTLPKNEKNIPKKSIRRPASR